MKAERQRSSGLSYRAVAALAGFEPATSRLEIEVTAFCAAVWDYREKYIITHREGTHTGLYVPMKYEVAVCCAAVWDYRMGWVTYRENQLRSEKI